MTLHHMKLQPEPFSQIRNSTKTIEIRLNDEKRRLIKIGDTIQFSLTTNPSETILTEVKDLYPFPNFFDLFNTYPTEDFGGKNTNDLLSAMTKYYSPEDQVKYGVLGIRIKQTH